MDKLTFNGPGGVALVVGTTAVLVVVGVVGRVAVVAAELAQCL
ncbi:hypothetical protein NP173_23780 [Salmonella enterica]|nr:hypothetical protein [Salmonella enterica]